MSRNTFLCLALLFMAQSANALDLSGFYRCSGTKTLLAVEKAPSPPPEAQVPPSTNNAPNSPQASTANKTALPPSNSGTPMGTNTQVASGMNSPGKPTPDNVSGNSAGNLVDNNDASVPIIGASPNPGQGIANASTSIPASSNNNNNQMPFTALLNFRLMDNSDNAYVYHQINDDGSAFLGTIYFEGDRLVANFDSLNKQLKHARGVTDLEVNPQDATLHGHFYIENVIKGNISCSKF